MKRGHTLASRGFPVGPQNDALAAAGVKNIYHNDLESAIKSVRKGEGLWVHTLRGLGTSRKGIEAAIDDLHARGAHAVDAATGWLSTGPNGAKLMSQAIASLSRERQDGGKNPEKNGRKGGIASGKKKAEGRMPWANIEKLWFNKSLDRDDLMERINGSGYKEISYSAIHKRLGPRGVAVGRRAREV